jgi:hypothetical protein
VAIAQYRLYVARVPYIARIVAFDAVGLCRLPEKLADRPAGAHEADPSDPFRDEVGQDPKGALPTFDIQIEVVQPADLADAEAGSSDNCPAAGFVLR